jgi:cysteine desulfurase
MKSSGIYLDYNATTPCEPRVVEKMQPYFTEIYGNPSNSLHRQGRLAAKAISEARDQVAKLIGAESKEIFFTSGATESNNLALFGITSFGQKQNRRRIVTNVVEHKTVLLPCKKLAKMGFEVIFLPVDSGGRVRIKDAEQAINDTTLMVSIQGANNEIGTLQPITEIANLAHKSGAWMHCDAAQVIGKLPFNVDGWNVDLVSISAHKFYGPKGIGALYIRGGNKYISIEPLFLGGGQENGLRSGTMNVPSIVGFGEACRMVEELVNIDADRITNLRDKFEQTLTKNIPSLQINGKNAHRLPNTSSLTISGIDADALLLNLPEVMMGTGSACTSGAIEPSHVLQAIGLSREDASSTVRASLGRYTSEEDIYNASSLIAEAVINLSTMKQ